MNKFLEKLPRDDIKKFAKEVNKKLVSSDYKNNRVPDPTTITEKQEKKIKIYVKNYFDRAVEKYEEYEEKKKARRAKNGHGHDVSRATPISQPIETPTIETPTMKGDGDVVMTDDEDVSLTPNSLDRKRKREDDVLESPSLTPSEAPLMKRLKEDEVDIPSPPPPPPPPLDGEAPLDTVADQVQILGEQEEAQLVAAEAERQKLREEEAALERENEYNMLAFEKEQQDKMVNGSTHIDPEALPHTHENTGGGSDPTKEDTSVLQHNNAQHEVMSH